MRRKFWRKLYAYSRRKFREHLNGEYKTEKRYTYSNGIKVSHHAITRYFERVEGYDMDKVLQEITTGLVDRVARDGDGKYVVGRLRATVLNNTVVTVDTTLQDLPNKQRPILNPIRITPIDKKQALNNLEIN